jgi:hypothetical protein
MSFNPQRQAQNLAAADMDLTDSDIFLSVISLLT